MDAFFAAVEQRNDPGLKGRPVIVGGDPRSRGVVSACSYEARKFGVHSAMPSRVAMRLCPHAVFIRPNFGEYHRVSQQVMDIFRSCTDLVEQLSIDEAYLDVTENRFGQPLAVRVARAIKEAIAETTGLTASAGVSYNKFLSKIASDYRKPNGLTVVVPGKAGEFLARLPIGRFYGVGKVTESRMFELGIKTGADLALVPRETLVRHFGKAGEFYYDMARGIDERPVITEWDAKSVGREHTLREDIDDIDGMHRLLDSLALDVEDHLADVAVGGRTVTLKVRYEDFSLVTRSITLPAPVSSHVSLAMYARDLLKRTEAGARKVRLLGISVSNLATGEPVAEGDRQLLLPL